MNGAILYPTHDELKSLNEAILKYGYWPIYTASGRFSNKDLGNLTVVLPFIFACGLLTGIIEKIIYPPLKINETVLG